MNKKDAIKMAVYSSLLRPCRRTHTHSTTFIPVPFLYILFRCEKIVRVGLSFGSRSYLTAPIYPSLSLSLLGNLTLPPFVVVCAPQHDDQISLSKWPPFFFSTFI
jgi:hypothetical protein